jgi:penicillin G amidase
MLGRTAGTATAWLAGLGAALLCALPAAAQPAAPLERLEIAGLDAPVEILRDRWGIAHIYAETERDLFFAQGFNVARDRLFQLELWRRQATGTLAEIQGRRALERDIGARLLRFRGDMDAELRHYHPRGPAIIGAFVDGINAWIALTEAQPDLLPAEFRMLGLRPGRWTEAVVISRHNGLYRNVTQELSIARLVAAVGEDQARELLDPGPGRPDLTLHPSIRPEAIPDGVLRRYSAARSGVSWHADDVLPQYRRGGEASAAVASPFVLAHAAALDLGDETWLHGSNNWVVAGTRTATRAPFMANDPHRAITVPSLRYWVHLNGPGWNVIGGGEPALPGVSIGHNGHGAWGLTIFSIDQEDLYVYDTNAADPGRYRYRGGWESMRVDYDTIRVRDEAPVVVPLRFTRHGPVLYEDSAAQRAYALRAAWLEVGGAPYLASLRMNQARTWEEFREACMWSYTPSENMIWADTSGVIGWQAVGIAPVRRGWSGLVPVPGDGSFEWDGYLDPRALPHAVNPTDGWFATANENNVPPGYPHALGVSGWADPARYARIAEVLDGGRRFTLADMMALQHDELSLHARGLTALLSGIEPPADLHAAFALLRDWDHVLAAGSAAAALYREWEPLVSRAVWQRSVPAAAQDLSFARPLHRAIDWLHAPDGRFGSDPVRARDALLIETLRGALAATRERFGPDPTAWRYGDARMKHVRLRHALSAVVRPDIAERLELGPLPRGGSGTTVNMTGDGMNQTSGASFRIVANLADWDVSVGTNTPGQSGDPDSPHYADLFELWATGRYFAVLYSRDRIEAATSAITVLEPRRER